MQTKNLSDIYKWTWVVLIILAIFLVVETLGSLRDLRDTNPAYNSINVSGEGEIFAIPDLATFSFSVSLDGDTVSIVEENVTKKMDKVLDALKSLGVEDNDIKTTDYSVWPKYVYTPIYCFTTPCPPSSSNQEQQGFSANHSVSVKVRNADNVGEVLSLVGKNGATNISSISFTVDNPEDLVNEARSLAIKDAKKKAKLLSKELGVRLRGVISFYDSTDGGVAPYYRESFGQGGDSASQSAIPTLSRGENKIRVVVNITYEIR